MVPNGVFSQANFSLTTWNPFIIVDQTRGHEVHLLDYEPTDLVDNNYFGMWEDDSDPATGKYYKTANNLPWAIDIPIEFAYPVEKVQIIAAHLKFAD
jgi:LruC domain-containing protein